MLQIFIITILIIFTCIALMSIKYFITGKSLNGTCGNSKENPCECRLIDRIKCSINQ